jgi:hypothetical protein
MIKCIGCPYLRRKTTRKGMKMNLVVYDCPEFPYMCALSGLLRPSSQIAYAAVYCGIDTSGCAVCGSPAYHSYGHEPVITRACQEHDAAWGAWLNKKDPDRQRLAPKGRNRQSAWVEMFREFVEDSRPAKK